jgi:tripartite-type tricarboxylate transporter receptor subunit TctC
MVVRINRRRMLSAAVLSAPALLGARAAHAQLGKGTTRIVIGTAPGSGSDLLTRLMAQKMGEIANMPFVVDNKSGANGTIAIQSVLAAPKDGSVLLASTPSSLIVQPLLNRSLTYDAARDFVGISGISETACVVVTGERPDAPKDLAELIARLGTTDANYGAQIIASFSHLGAELFLQRTKRKATLVIYRGSPALTTALMQGDLLFAVESVAGQQSAIKAGQVRPLAVTSAQRLPGLPNVPTLGEVLGAPLVVIGWIGLFAPAGTPAPAVEALETAALKALADPDLRSRFEAMSADPMAVDGRALMDQARREKPQWAETIEKADIRLQN